MTTPTDARPAPGDKLPDTPSNSNMAPPEPPHPDGSDELRDASDEEIRDLRHIIDKVPRKVWIVLLASGAERFTFYVVSTPWQNYMQNALGLGQSQATTIFNAYYMYSFLTPIPFAIVSDSWLGRYTVLCISLSLYLCAIIAQFVTSLPSIFQYESGLAGLVISMVLMGLGVGGTKATITPFIGDQYPVKPPQSKTLTTGERIVIDRTLTIQYVYNVYYWITNIAALSLLAATYLEKEIGYWAANLLALCSCWIPLTLLVVFRRELDKVPAQGGVLLKAGRVLGCAIRGKFKLDAAQPEHQLEKYNRAVPWTSRFVLEIRSGLRACEVMTYFALFQCGLNQMTNNLVSQAGQMQLTHFPNDGIQVLNPIACVVIGPFIQKILYPGLARLHIPFGPIMRMTAAFLTMAATFAYASGVQKMIYNSGPCYDAPLACPAAQRPGEETLPNAINVWVQTPIYVILAFSEIFGFVTLSEYSYSMAPKDMRTVIQSMRLLSAGIGSAIGIALGAVSNDPDTLWMYVSLSASLAVAALLFWAVVGHYDKDDQDLNTMFLKDDQEEANNNEQQIQQTPKVGTDAEKRSA